MIQEQLLNSRSSGFGYKLQPTIECIAAKAPGQVQIVHDMCAVGVLRICADVCRHATASVSHSANTQVQIAHVAEKHARLPVIGQRPVAEEAERVADGLRRLSGRRKHLKENWELVALSAHTEEVAVKGQRRPRVPI